MDLHVYLHTDPADSRKLDQIIQLLKVQQKEILTMAASVDDVIAAVQKETTVEQSVITLLNQFASQVQAAGTDPIKLQQALDLITSNTAALSAAVTANTPAATPPAA